MGFSAVKAAIAGGCDAIITHEATFYFHRDELENIRALKAVSFMKETALLKKKLLDDIGGTRIGKNREVRQ